MTTLILFLYLQFLDAVTTYAAINKGTFGEFNPVPGAFMSLFGLGLGIIVFKLLCGVCGWGINHYYGKIPAFINWVGVAVVLWNLTLLLLF